MDISVSFFMTSEYWYLMSHKELDMETGHRFIFLSEEKKKLKKTNKKNNNNNNKNSDSKPLFVMRAGATSSIMFCDIMSNKIILPYKVSSSTAGFEKVA